MDPSQRRQSLSRTHHSIYRLVRYARGMGGPASRTRRCLRPQRPPEEPKPSAGLSALRALTSRSCCSRICKSRIKLLDETATGTYIPIVAVSSGIIPNTQTSVLDSMPSRIYNARFIADDGTFVSTGQNTCIRMYDTTPDIPVVTHEVDCANVSWTVTDFDVHEKRFLVYSSINHLVQFVDLNRKAYGFAQQTLDCSTENSHMAMWSVVFSHIDGNNIIGGTGYRGRDTAGIVLYNLVQFRVLHTIPAHTDDINSVCFLNRETDPNLILSGGDDCLVKLWDLREATRCESTCTTQRAACTFVGHTHGITHCSSRDDGRFFITTSKDQSIKLWDIRRPSSENQSMWRIRHDYSFDYRFAAQAPPPPEDPSATDSSVVTYCGHHTTMQTLIRSRFSPKSTTGQRYIYTGSRDGSCVIYEATNGKFVQRLHGFHKEVTRDVSWHPHLPLITTCSWDGRIGMWRPSENASEEAEPGSAHNCDPGATEGSKMQFYCRRC